MSDQTRDEKIRNRFRISRRGFVKIAGTTAAAVGLAKWTPKVFGQSSPAAPVGWEIAPTVPGAIHLDTGGSGIQALLAYNPATDPDAKYLRSIVPLASRVVPLTTTQAQPLLSPLPQSINESFGYVPLTSNSPTLFRYGSASSNIFANRFFQYQDIVVPQITGSGNDAFLTGAPPYVPTFIPTAAHVDAAHRNGALAIGWLGSPNNGDPTYYFTMKAADGSYPVGNKLVDLAAYFGFDGYFFNLEGGIYAPDVQGMALAMKARAKALGLSTFYLQYYDNGININQGSNDAPLTSGAFDSYMPEYFWGSSNVENNVATMQADGLNPYTTQYFGLLTSNNDQTVISQINQYAPLVIPTNGNGGSGVASLALFTANNGITTGDTSTTYTATDNANLAASALYWSSSTGNPALAPASGQDLGVANFITERSAITSFPFLCRFNVGWGAQFCIYGNVSKPNSWYNLGIQDILPTWEWWTKDFNSNAIPSGLLTAGYDTTVAFDGGSSLQVSGELGPNNPTELRLFKTNLPISGNDPGHSIKVTYLSGQSGPTNLHIGLIFADSPTHTQWLSVDASGPQELPWCAWSQAVLKMDSYAGRTIVAVSLGFQVGQNVTSASSYSIHIGEIALVNATTFSGTVPSNLALENSLISADGNMAQLRLTWDYDPKVWYYDIFRRRTPGSTQNMIWLGRVNCDCYYVQAMPRIGTEASTVVQLIAIAPDGSTLDSDGATINFSWT